MHSARVLTNYGYKQKGVGSVGPLSYHRANRPCGEVAELVDRVALEMRSTGNRTGGSNPSLSANSLNRMDKSPTSHVAAYNRYIFLDKDIKSCYGGA